MLALLALVPLADLRAWVLTDIHVDNAYLPGSDASQAATPASAASRRGSATWAGTR